MTIHSETFDFWRNGGEKYIIPGGGDPLPEGWDPRPFMTMLSAGQDTVEFGCGIGRLCKLFDTNLYHGIDINPTAIELAHKNFPDHKFTVLDYNDPLPDAAFYYAYAVFLHIDDETLPQILAKLPASCKRFCIAEVMGREWRLKDQKDPPVFCRDASEYVGMMEKEGFNLSAKFSFPYLHYYRKLIKFPEKFREHLGVAPDAPVNTNIDFLLFYRD